MLTAAVYLLAFKFVMETPTPAAAAGPTPPAKGVPAYYGASRLLLNVTLLLFCATRWWSSKYCCWRCDWWFRSGFMWLLSSWRFFWLMAED